MPSVNQKALSDTLQLVGINSSFPHFIEVTAEPPSGRQLGLIGCEQAAIKGRTGPLTAAQDHY